MRRTTMAFIWMVAMMAACDGDFDEDWDTHPSHVHDDPWHDAPWTPPAQPFRDAAVNVVPTIRAHADVPAIAWVTQSDEIHLQTVATSGAFPDSFGLHADAVRPPDVALTYAADAEGGRFAFGYVVSTRFEQVAATGCNSGGCGAPRPCAATSSCAGIGCGSRGACGTPCGAMADAGCLPTPASEAPGASITGVVDGYVVLYAERAIPAGSLLAGVFNDYAPLAAGIHLVRMTPLTTAQAEQASSCRHAAAARAVSQYNAARFTSHADEAALRADLSLREAFGDESAGVCLREFEQLSRAALLAQRCRFRAVAAAMDARACLLRIRAGQMIPLSLPF